jgi:Metallo-peptidase family M12
MKKNIIISFCLVFFLASAQAQIKKPTETLVEQTQEIKLWNIKTSKQEIKGFGTFDEIELIDSTINKIYYSKANNLEIALVDKNGEKIIANLSLRPNEVIGIKENNNNYIKGVDIPKFFNGSIAGMKETNNVIFTIAPNFISLQAYLPTEKINISKSDNKENDVYTIQHSGDITLNNFKYECELGKPVYKSENETAIVQRSTTAAIDKCTNVFIDCSNNLYIQRGSTVQNAINYVYAIWNGVTTCYLNEQMNVKISEINIWTSADPFNHVVNTTVANKSFADYYQNNYFGNMAMLLDWSSLNGAIAGGYGWAKGNNKNECGNYNANPSPDWNMGSFIYCNLSWGGIYSNFPIVNVQGQTYLCTHELGHLFGSAHTQNCGWPGGPIDLCVAREGSCTQNPPLPVNGGTMMSYCSQASVGLNFNAGFGPLPGNVIRNYVVNNNCIPLCGCVPNRSIGNVASGSFNHIEASNQVTANGIVANSNTLLKLDAGVQIILQPGFKALNGSKVKAYINGCGGVE